MLPVAQRVRQVLNKLALATENQQQTTMWSMLK
jgi:hypothetical protein